VSQLEAGQREVQNTQGQQAAGQPLPAQAAAPAIQAPDPVDFAAKKMGGNLTVPERDLQSINTAQWLPLLEQMARSNEASSGLRRAYIKMLSQVSNEPFSGATAVVDKRAIDSAVENGF